jgi:hypothetical protein
LLDPADLAKPQVEPRPGPAFGNVTEARNSGNAVDERWVEIEYDLTVDTDRLSPEECARAILAALPADARLKGRSWTLAQPEDSGIVALPLRAGYARRVPCDDFCGEAPSEQA